MAHVRDLRRAMMKGGNDRRVSRPPGFGESHILRKDYSPVPASDYFNKARFISVNDNDRLYIYETELADREHATEPYLLFLHGGGYSGLTWAPVIQQLLPMLIRAEYGAVDLRGHGRSECEQEMDLSVERVTEDLFQLVQKLELGERPLVLIGHSMGGAFAIHLAAKLQADSEVHLKGLIVIDVVEGSALESLSGMQHVLRNRPREFQTLQSAIEWCVRSGQTRNTDSARVSMPGQLKLLSGEIPQSTLIEDAEILPEEPSSPVPSSTELPPSGATPPTTTTNHEAPSLVSQEEVEIKLEVSSASSAPPKPSIMPSPSTATGEKYVWRIDLKKTEPFWRSWFEGISSKFLSIDCPKLLLLAGVDRLDKELMVAQMQGRFQMSVLHSVGHIVHEDAPDRVAEHIGSFLARMRIITNVTNIRGMFPGH